jgi:hypothetical protein
MQIHYLIRNRGRYRPVGRTVSLRFRSSRLEEGIRLCSTLALIDQNLPVNDEPWKRAYVVFKQGADTQFVPDGASTASKGATASL